MSTTRYLCIKKKNAIRKKLEKSWCRNNNERFPLNGKLICVFKKKKKNNAVLYHQDSALGIWDSDVLLSTKIVFFPPKCIFLSWLSTK